MAYEDLRKDLNDTSESFEDGNYFLVTITELDLATQYPLQFRWKYKDGTYGKDWSGVYYVTTPGATVPLEPNLDVTDVVGGAGFIKVTWNGKDASNNTIENIDRVDIYISGMSFPDGSKPAGNFKESGTQTFTAEPGIYIVQLKAVRVDGTTSFFSSARTVTVTEVGEPNDPPVAPTGFSARAILGGIELTWNGTYSGGAAWSGFQAVNIYAGTSTAATGGTYIKVGQMTANKTTNKIVIPIDGTYVRYGFPAYIHASSINKATPPAESSISANVANATPSQVVNTDIINEAITSAKIALAAITEVKIDNNAITAAKIATAAITETKIASDAITAPKIAAGAIEAGKIAAGAITADKIAANAIEADKIAANAITAGKIAANAITAGNIVALAITGDKIAANTIDVGKLAANTISVGNLEAGDIKATSFIRAGTAGSARVEISSSTVGSVLPGLTVYDSGGNQMLRAPLTGGLTITGALTATSISTSSGNFDVSTSGILTAKSADIRGSIKATSGYIGGETSGIYIANGAIQNDVGGSQFKLDSSGKARFGSATGNAIVINPTASNGGYYLYHTSGGDSGSASSVFNVSTSGVLTATGANFSGTITNGTDYWNSNNTFRLGGENGIKKASSSSNSITIGSDVTFSGSLSGADGTFSGTLQASSGYFGSSIDGWRFDSNGYLYAPGLGTYLYPTTSPGGNANTYAFISTDRGISATKGVFTGTGSALQVTGGDLEVVGTGTLTGRIYANGGITVGSNKTIAMGTGNITTGGDISSLGAVQGWTLVVTGNGSTSGSGTILANYLGSTSSNGQGAIYQDANGYLRVRTGTGSSRNIKDNIEPFLNNLNYTEIINSMELVTFNYKPEIVIDPEVKQLGMIVEDLVQHVDNEFLIEYKNEIPVGIYYEKIPLFLVKAFQEMTQKINSLQQRLDALEG